jgi:Ecdysteroid kinase-like family
MRGNKGTATDYSSGRSARSRVAGVVSTVKALLEVGAALLPMRWVPASFPVKVCDVDLAYLNNALRAASGPAKIISADPVEGTTGTTDRVRLALTWDRSEGPDLPPHVFVKSTPLTGKNRTMVAALSMARNEVLFYDRARSALGPTVAPKCYAAHSGLGARHMLLLEDVTDSGGIPHAMADDIDFAYAKGMMVTLGELHAAFWESPRFEKDLDFVRPERLRPGFGLLLRQFRQMRSKLLRSEQYDFPREVRKVARFVNEHDWAWHANWERGPQTLIHGDSHLGNTFGRSDGGVGLLDWQVLYRAPGMRDVTYFLTHSVPTEVRRAHTDELLNIYLESLVAGGVQLVPTLSQAWDAVRLFAFDAWDSAAICLVWPGLQAPENVAAGVARANASIVDFDVMPTLRQSV